MTKARRDDTAARLTRLEHQHAERTEELDDLELEVERFKTETEQQEDAIREDVIRLETELRKQERMLNALNSTLSDMSGQLQARIQALGLLEKEVLLVQIDQLRMANQSLVKQLNDLARLAPKSGETS